MILKLVLFLVFLAVASCSSFTDKDYDREFNKFVEVHQKVYSDNAERAYRSRVFKKNFRLILAHNQNKSNTFELGVNQFADLTNSEFRERYLGFSNKSLSSSSSSSSSSFSQKHQPKPDVQPPTTLDWRGKGAVTPVKDQGQCGSCWAFSATGSIEGAWFLSKKTLVSLSEQNLVDCSRSYGNKGCGGGVMDDAFRYVIANKGIDTEKSYAYDAEDEGCSFKSANVGATVSGYRVVARGDEEDLLSAVAQQPVSVAIDAGHPSFQFYRSGVYHEPSCSSRNPDHGVLVVGYGTDGGKDYWLVKNSWGVAWGDEGFVKMIRNKNNNCGIATAASYPVV